MKIETKYNVGDEVWYITLGGRKAQESKIIKILTLTELYILGKPTSIKYVLKAEDNNMRYESELFPSKQDLLNSL